MCLSVMSSVYAFVGLWLFHISEGVCVRGRGAGIYTSVGAQKPPPPGTGSFRWGEEQDRGVPGSHWALGRKLDLTGHIKTLIPPHLLPSCPSSVAGPN